MPKYNQKTATVVVDGHHYTVSYNVRSDLYATLETYWLGNPNSNVGAQYLELDGEHVKAGRFLIERKDIIVVQGERINTFVEVDGDISVQPWTHAWGERDSKKRNGPVCKAACKRARRAAEIAYKQAVEIGYVENERYFLTEKPWLLCHGLTVAEAVQILRPYAYAGWQPGDDPVENSARENTRENQIVPGHDDEAKRTEAAVAGALEAVAAGIRAGKKLEEMTIMGTRPEPVISQIFSEIFREVRDAMIQHRDHGTTQDRINNQRGDVPFPADKLTPAQLRWYKEAR